MEILGDRPGDISAEVAAGRQCGPRDAVAVVNKQLWNERSGKAVKQIEALYVAAIWNAGLAGKSRFHFRTFLRFVRTRTLMKCTIAALRLVCLQQAALSTV